LWLSSSSSPLSSWSRSLPSYPSHRPTEWDVSNVIASFLLLSSCAV
jgi:hypothetical protein